MARYVRYLLLAFVFLGSCKYFPKNGEPSTKPLARVGEDYLLYSDIQSMVKNTGSKKDSIEMVKGMIEDWIKQKLVIQKAKTYLPEDKLDVEKQVNNYRESLITYLYEKELVLQKLDTVVSDEEKRQYFEEFKDNFELKENVVQLFYLKVANNAPKIDSVQILINSKAPESKIKLSDYSFQYADDFSISDSTWYEAKVVFNNLPFDDNFLMPLCQSQSSSTVMDSVYTYFVKVNECRSVGELAPYTYVADDITKIILNKRKLKLVKSTYDNIYQEALRKNGFEIY